MKNLMKKYALCVLCSVLFLGGVSFSDAHAKTTIIIGHGMPTNHIYHDVYELFQSRLTELSGKDTFDIKYYPSGALGDWINQLDQTINGSINITFAWAVPELDPRLAIGNLGLRVDTWEQAKKLYSTGALDDLYTDIYKNLGLVNMGTIATGFTGFMVRKGLEIPLNVPQDAKGFKMRIPPYPMGVARYNVLGFTPITMPFSELHTALQTGTVDGGSYNPISEVLMFTDTLEAFVYTKEHFEQSFFLVNNAWLSSLPQKEQDWIRQAAEEAISLSWAKSEQRMAARFEEAEKVGLKVVIPSKEQNDRYRNLMLQAEVPMMEKVIGKERIDAILKDAGIERSSFENIK